MDAGLGSATVHTYTSHGKGTPTRTFGKSPQVTLALGKDAQLAGLPEAKFQGLLLKKKIHCRPPKVSLFGTWRVTSEREFVQDHPFAGTPNAH